MLPILFNPGQYFFFGTRKNHNYPSDQKIYPYIKQIICQGQEGVLILKRRRSYGIIRCWKRLESETCLARYVETKWIVNRWALGRGGGGNLLWCHQSQLRDNDNESCIPITSGLDDQLEYTRSKALNSFESVVEYCTVLYVIIMLFTCSIAFLFSTITTASPMTVANWLHLKAWEISWKQILTRKRDWKLKVVLSFEFT